MFVYTNIVRSIGAWQRKKGNLGVRSLICIGFGWDLVPGMALIGFEFVFVQFSFFRNVMHLEGAQREASLQFCSKAGFNMITWKVRHVRMPSCCFLCSIVFGIGQCGQPETIERFRGAH